jgi:EAL domain-containing protein (putative c-di-GMP-specific phosphodiesterase class I)
MTAGAGIGLALVVSIAVDAGDRTVFSALLCPLIAGAATSFIAGQRRNTEWVSAAHLSAIFGWPLLVAAMALASGGSGGYEPAEIVAVIVAVVLSSLLRTPVAAVWLGGLVIMLGLAIWDAGSLTRTTWIGLIGVGAVGVIGLGGRFTIDRLVRVRGQLHSLMERVPFGDALDATAKSIVEEVARAGGFDAVLLAALESGGTIRHLAHATRLTGPLPLEPGAPLTEARAAYLRARLAGGPWIADWESADDASGYDAQMYAAGLRSMLNVPILRDGTIVGVLAVGLGTATAVGGIGRRALLHESMASVIEAASLVGGILAPKLLEIDDRALERTVLLTMIEEGRFVPVFQPIVELATRQIVGYEALTRFANGERPDLVFTEAERLGIGRNLEAATIAAAVKASVTLQPATAYLSVNLSPDFALSRIPRKLFAPLQRPLTVEVTEHVAIADYSALRTAVRSLGRDVKLAVDDAGAGFASLRHVLELGPDIVKLDIEFIRKIDTDPARQALVAGMVHFAARGPFRLIAEGVETEAEREALLALGLAYGQGYLFGRAAQVGRPAVDHAEVA